MNEDLKDLLAMMPSGAFKDVDQLSEFIEAEGLDQVYALTPEGVFKDEEEFMSYASSLGIKKKEEELPSTSPEEDVVSLSEEERETALLGGLFDEKTNKKAANIAKAKNLRKTSRLNPDGSESTVLMASAEADGKFIVYPTLFPKDPSNYNRNPETWMELDADAAFEEAKKRDEVFFFDTEEEAQRFAEGSWKGATGIPKVDLSLTDFETVPEAMEREAGKTAARRQQLSEEEKARQEFIEEARRRAAESPILDFEPETKEVAELEAKPIIEGIEEEGMRAAADPVLKERKKKEFEKEFQRQSALMMEREELRGDEEYIKNINADMSQYLGQTPENALKDLKSKYSKYGFIFEKGATEDYVKATAKNGQSLNIPINPLYVNADTMPQDLKAFIDANARKPKAYLTEVERMGMDFFADKDMDYITYRDMQNRYEGNKKRLYTDLPLRKPDDLRAYLVEKGLEVSKEELDWFENMYTDNVKRADANDIYGELRKDNKNIRDILFDKEYEELRTQFDVIKRREYDARNEKFLEFDAKFAKDINQLQNLSMEFLGVGLDEILDFETDNPVLEETRDVITQTVASLMYQKDQMSKLYDIEALPFLDEMYDKQTKGDIVYGRDAWKNSWNTGLARGNAIVSILPAVVGMVNLNTLNLTEPELAKEIADHIGNANSGKFSIGDVTNRRAQGQWEYFRSLRNRPFEFIGALVGNSLAQMLPIASELAPIIAGPTIARQIAKDAKKLTPLPPQGKVVGGLLSIGKGSLKSINTISNATQFAVEYGNAMLETMEKLHGDQSDPLNVEKALLDPRVWQEGSERGIKRGLPITLVEYFGNKYAGRIFGQAKYATKAQRVLGDIVETAIIDPILEGLGEASAQLVADGEFDIKEIENEMLSSLGQKLPNLVANRVLDMTNIREQKLIKRLKNLDFVLTESASGARISNWVNEQEKKGKITKEDAEIIKNNISARTEAREILNVDEYNKDKPTKDSEVEARLAELIAADKKLGATDALKVAYSELRREITKEIKEISTTRKLREADQQTDLSVIKKETEAAPTEAAPTEDKPIEADEKNIGEVNPTQTYSFRFEEGNVPPAFQRLTPTGMIEAAKGLFKRKKSVTLMFKGQQLIDAGLATQAAPTEVAPTKAAPKQKLQTKGLKSLANNLFFSEGKDQTPRDKDNIERVANVTDRARKAIASIANILPNTNIVLHDTQDSYQNATGKKGRGGFDSSTNTIHINLDKANETTVAHEVFHAVLFNKLGADVELQSNLKQMVTSVAKVVSKRSDLGRYLDKFIKGYEKDVEGMSQESAEAYLNEERLSELMGVLSANYDQLNKPQKNAVIEFIKKVAAKFGIEIGTEFTKTDEAVIDFLNVMSDKISYGEEITEIDIELLDNGTNPIGTPTQIELPLKEQIDALPTINFKDNYKYSLIDSSKSMDIEALIEDIHNKKEKVWFWVADQLGLDAELGIDAGPSFAFSTEGDIWASGMPIKDLLNRINESSYIFIISGSPQKSHMFNKAVFDIYAESLGDYQTYKDAVIGVATKNVREVLEAHDSWESLRDDPSGDFKPSKKDAREKLQGQGIKNPTSAQVEAYRTENQRIGTGRKKFLLEHNLSGTKPTSKYHKAVLALGKEFVDPDSMRDGFFVENDFQQNDIMLVLKPTGAREGSNHSTYANTIEGEVIGVPDKKIDAAEIMPKEIREKIEGKSRAKQSQSIAPYGVGVREVAPRDIREQKDVESRAGEFGKFKDEYKKAMARIEQAVAKMKGEGKTKREMEKRVLSSLKRTKIYKGLDDILREELVRDAKKKVGVRIKSAPSVAKLFGDIDDVKKITLTEKQLLIKRLKELAKGAKDAARAIKKIRKEVTEAVRELSGQGKITPKQVVAIINKLNSLQEFREDKIAEFVDYMAKVFKKAQYQSILAEAKKMIPTAKTNVKRGKLGMLDGGLFEGLVKLFTIKPNLIPLRVLNKYMSLLEEASKGAVLDIRSRLSVAVSVKEILDAIRVEQELIPELRVRFYNSANLVRNPDKSINFAASINEMLNKEEITQEEADLMKKYKNQIVPKKPRKAKSDEQIKEEMEEYIEAIEEVKEMLLNGKIDLPTRLERDAARKLLKLIEADKLRTLELRDLNNILKILSNINNGYFPHYAQLLLEQLEAMDDVQAPLAVTLAAKILPIEKAIGKIEDFVLSLLNKGSNYVDRIIKRNPNFFIDQVFGEFKGKELMKALFAKMAEGVSNLKTELSTVAEQIQNAQARVEDSFKRNPKKVMMSKFKQMAYLLQLEYNNNPEHQKSKQVHQARAIIQATMKAIKEGDTIYGSTTEQTEKAISMFEEILEKFSTDGEIDVDKLFRSFNDAEKASVKIIGKINRGMTEIALFTSSVIRGKRVPTFANYVHHRVLVGSKNKQFSADVDSLESYGKSLKPSTKAKSLIEREGTVEPLLFDPYTSTYRGAKMTLMDFYLTAPIRTARKAMNLFNEKLKGRSLTPLQNSIRQALDKAVERVIEQTLVDVANITSDTDQILNRIARTGYRATLARGVKLVAEGFVNFIAAMLADPASFTIGLSMSNRGMIEVLPRVMRNLNSKQTSTLFSGNTLSGRMVDLSINEERVRRGRVSPYSQIGNAINLIYNQTIRRTKNFAEKIADAMISSPDKVVNIPMWQGSFVKKFYELTNQKPDFEKIVANDEAYMNKYKQELEEATAFADGNSVTVGASGNVALNAARLNRELSKGTSRENFRNFIKTYDNYLTRFMIWEWTNARTGVGLLYHGNMIDKKRGTAILAATVLRVTIYNLLIKRYGNIIAEMLIGEDEEEIKKSFSKALGQAVVTSANDMILGRNFGNIARSLINVGVETFNQSTLDFLREGDYDMYEDAVAYSMLLQDPNDYRTKTVTEMLGKGMAGPYGPLINTIELAYKVYKAEPKKDPAAIERQRKEKMIRLPVEIAGQLGLLPFYADIRKIVLQDIYKDMGKRSSSSSWMKFVKTLEDAGDKQGAKNAYDFGVESGLIKTKKKKK